MNLTPALLKECLFRHVLGYSKGGFYLQHLTNHEVVYYGNTPDECYAQWYQARGDNNLVEGPWTKGGMNA